MNEAITALQIGCSSLPGAVKYKLVEQSIKSTELVMSRSTGSLEKKCDCGLMIKK